MNSIADAYSATGAAWQAGPGRIYDRLAEVTVDASPVPLAGAAVLDVGAGTGAASRAAVRAGAARVVAADSAVGMLAYEASGRPPATVADVCALPFAGAAFDAAIAAFSLNHVVDAEHALEEMARVTRPGGALVIATYAADDTHPVKGAVEGALAARGWTPPGWYRTVREQATPRWATVEACVAAMDAAGLSGTVEVDAIGVPFPDLLPRDLVAWRLGMAQHAPFVAQLPADERPKVVEEAVARLGEAPPLVRSILVTRALNH